MRIVIVKKQTKDGKRYCAYKFGLLSRMGIYCSWNYISFTTTISEQRCIEFAKQELTPDVKPRLQFVREVEITIRKLD